MHVSPQPPREGKPSLSPYALTAMFQEDAWRLVFDWSDHKRVSWQCRLTDEGPNGIVSGRLHSVLSPIP